MVSRVLANPWLWLGLLGLFAGLALGEGALWLLALVRKLKGRARSLPSALAGAALALALLSGVGLLVLPAKEGLASALSGPSPFLWTGLCLGLGSLLGLRPLPGGGLILSLALAAWAFAGPGLASWLPLSPGQDLAKLLPFGKTGETWSCELIIYKKDTVPTTSRLDLASGEAGLVVETLGFSGPATLLSPGTLYRIVGLVSAQGRVLTAFPGKAALLDLLLPLPKDLGPGQRGRLVQRSRASSPALTLVALEPLFFGLEGPRAQTSPAVTEVTAVTAVTARSGP